MADYVVGKNSILSLLTVDPARVFKVYVSETLKPDKRIDAIYEAAQARGIPIARVPRMKLDQMTESLLQDDPDLQHQGVIAAVSPKPLMDLDDLVIECRKRIEDAGEFPLVLMLDGLSDPRNFGAILRVADAAGVAGVIVAKHKNAGFGPSVSKTASGAEASVQVVMVPNLVQALERLKQIGFWVVGAANSPDAVAYTDQTFDTATVLVLGSEGQGLGRLVAEHCDFRVKIPMHGVVESLNVATAAAVLTFDIQHRLSLALKAH